MNVNVLMIIHQTVFTLHGNQVMFTYGILLRSARHQTKVNTVPL